MDKLKAKLGALWVEIIGNPKAFGAVFILGMVVATIANQCPEVSG